MAIGMVKIFLRACRVGAADACLLLLDAPGCVAERGSVVTIHPNQTDGVVRTFG